MPIDLIDTIKPKNNGTFPMVEAEDVVVGKGTADEKRLPEALAEAGKVAAVDTAMPPFPADDHVPSTQLLAEELAKKLSITGGTLSGTLTVNASVEASSFKIPQDSVPQGSAPHAGSIISIPNGSQLAGAVGIVYERIGNIPSGYTRKRFMGVSGGNYDTRLYIGDGDTQNADSGMTTVFGLHLPDDRTWARHDLWFTDKASDEQGSRTWWGLVQDGDELRIVKDKGTPKAYLPLTGGTLTGDLKFQNESSELWVSNLKSSVGTPIYDVTSARGFNFLGLYTLCGYTGAGQRGKVFFTQENATTNWIDVTTLKEGGTPIADKYAAKAEVYTKAEVDEKITSALGDISAALAAI